MQHPFQFLPEMLRAAEYRRALEAHYHEPQLEVRNVVIFPEGEWPREDLGGTGHGSIGPFPIRERFCFMRSLHPEREIVGITFGSAKCEYRAFLYGNKVVVEGLDYGNASYCFRIQENFDAWLERLENSKYRVWSRAVDLGFVRKVHHTEGWQERIREFLAS